MNLLTVELLIKILEKEEPKSLVAVQDSQNGCTFLIEGNEFIKQNVYLRKEAREQKEYYLEEDLGEDELANAFVKTILIGAC